MTSIDDIAAGRGQCVPPGELGSRSSLNSDDFRGLLRRVGAAVADDIIRCYFGDRLGAR